MHLRLPSFQKLLPTQARLIVGLQIAASMSLSAAHTDLAPGTDERQLPFKMHSEMKVRPVIRVGQSESEADLTGRDHRVLQAAVDYVANLGGGTVEIGPGTYEMRDSLHLRPYVTVRGTPGKTVLRKSKASTSALARDGDFGEEQITVHDAQGFEVGSSVTIWDKNSGGFHTTVARIIGRTGNTFALDRPLNADCMVSNGAQAATVFGVISGYDLKGCRLEGLTIDGNKAENPPINGCRGAGIYLYRGFGTVIENCTVRNFNGDGIGFQQSNDVVVRNCISEGNTSLGFHPGSGSQRPTIEHSVARANGEDGLFLCWRVRHGTFQKNLFENNGRFGISIGHKDTDNLFTENQVRSNQDSGVFFRDESAAMAGHRNTFEGNLIENNGKTEGSAGVRVRGETSGLEFKRNTIRDTRPAPERKQTVGFLLEQKVGEVKLTDNTVEAKTSVVDRREKKP